MRSSCRPHPTAVWGERPRVSGMTFPTTPLTSEARVTSSMGTCPRVCLRSKCFGLIYTVPRVSQAPWDGALGDLMRAALVGQALRGQARGSQ